MTAAELRAAIQSYCQSDEASFLTYIDTAIRMAEMELYRMVDFPAEQRVVEFSGQAAGTHALALPFGYSGFVSLTAWRAGQPPVTLYERGLSYIRSIYGPVPPQGRPREVAVTETQLVLGPALDAVYDVTLVCESYPQSILSAPGGVSWLGTHAPEALLYSAIMHALLYLKAEQAALQAAGARRDEAVARFAIAARNWFAKQGEAF